MAAAGSPELTLADFRADQDSVYDIGAHYDERAKRDRPGVVIEIAGAFSYKSSDLGALIEHVAPYPTLQDNVAFAKETLSLPDVQERLGYEDKDGIPLPAAGIANRWCENAGLQTPVRRPLMEPAGAEEVPEKFDATLVFPGVYRWMNRMAELAVETARTIPSDRLVLVSDHRKIGKDEVEPGDPAKPDMTVNAYMGGHLFELMAKTKLFGTVEVIGLDPKEKGGPAVMANAAKHLARRVDLSTAHVLVPAVAGNWPQKGAQARAALQKAHPGFDALAFYRQLWVASDEFPLGVTGDEPKTTHQNPLSAIGNILRSAMLLSEQH